MYHGKYEAKNLQHRRRRIGKTATLLLSLLVLATMTVSGTLAYLTTNSGPLTNTFTPSVVTCEVTENFNGTTKSNVNVTNTGDIDAYIRVKLVTYRVNAQNQHIGGTADIPTFTLGEGWNKYGEYYYYTQPVAPGREPANALNATGITLIEYNDADGGKQVIEVIAEAIQSEGGAALAAWGVDPSNIPTSN